MKKFIICAFLALVGTLIFQSCSYLPPNKEEVQTMVQDYSDSIVYEQLNPVFSTANDIVVYRDEISKKLAEDSIFFSLTNKTLIDVASVCLKKYGYITKHRIVEEYTANGDVYKNLPATTEQKSDSNMEGSGVTKVDSNPERVIIGTDYQYVTDTIDGVPRKVLYKTEKSYEK